MKLYLASKSPRRHELLKQINIEFTAIDVDIDETWDGEEIAREHVLRLALEKAQAGKEKIGNEDDAVVLGADTIVVLDGVILGKAENKHQAVNMLQQLSGRTHQVYSAVALINGTQQKTAINMSRVSFKPLTDPEIQHYCETGEPIGKAGAYAIQGNAAVFIERLEGSYSGVMGLPLYEVAHLLLEGQRIED